MRISHTRKIDLFGAALLQPVQSWPVQGAPELAALERALANQEGLGGPEIPRFEDAFAVMHGLVTEDGAPDGTHVISATNGTHTLEMILEGLGIGAGDRVLVPAMTWQATAGAVLNVNATPVLIDSDDNWTISVAATRAELERTEGTAEFPVAIIAVHLYDRAADVAALFELCKEFGVFLIEDCAHAHGADLWGRPLGTNGIAGSWSFQASKGFTTGGEGGAMNTSVAYLARRLRSAVSCGRPVDPIAEVAIEGDAISAYWREAFAARVAKLKLAPYGDQSGNYRMSNLTAALGTAQAERFPAWYAARNATLQELTALLPQVPGITYRNQPGVTRSVAYMLAFSYDPEQFAGMDNDLFREVLAYKLGNGETQLVLPTYDPLGGGAPGYRSAFYNPGTSRRHLINAEYLAAIDPSAKAMPRAHEIRRTGITIQHSFLREENAAAILVEALNWMHQNAAMIVAEATPAAA